MEVGLSCDKKGPLISELTAHFDVYTYTGPEIVSIWHLVEGPIRASADWSRGEFLPEDALKMLLERKMTLWLFTREKEIFLTLLTEVRDYPRRRSCIIYAATGKKLGEVWRFALTRFRQWALDNSIDDVEAVCRDAVARKLSRLGFFKTANVMRFSLKETL
jgi:hypothetical protein